LEETGFRAHMSAATLKQRTRPA